MPIKWYNWIDMERIIDSIITDIPKKKIKEQFCKTFKHPKFGLIEINIQTIVNNCNWIDIILFKTFKNLTNFIISMRTPRD